MIIISLYTIIISLFLYEYSSYIPYDGFDNNGIPILDHIKDEICKLESFFHINVPIYKFNIYKYYFRNTLLILAGVFLHYSIYKMKIVDQQIKKGYLTKTLYFLNTMLLPNFFYLISAIIFMISNFSTINFPLILS